MSALNIELLDKFTSTDLRHYAKRAKIYGLTNEQKIFRKKAWKIAHEKEVGTAEEKELFKALKKLGKVPKLSTTCVGQDCQTCEKLTKLLGEQLEKEPWQLNLELYRWQKECKDKWERNAGSGIVKVITAAGKTILSLSVIEYLYRKYERNKLKTIIVVPKIALLDQWFQDLEAVLNVPNSAIGLYYGERKDDIEDKKIMIYVLDSARKYLTKHLKGVSQDTFLIVDECHRAGSKANRKIFQSHFDYTLGLSATPERRSDYGFEEVLLEGLGQIIYTYSYSDARGDGIIPPYRIKRVAVSLQENEKNAYRQCSKKLGQVSENLVSEYPWLRKYSGDTFLKELGRIQENNNDPLVRKFTVVANQRKAIVHESRSKIACLKYLIQNEIDTRARILIFHERIKLANEIYEYLSQNGIDSAIYHTGLHSSERRKNLQDYRDKSKNVLVTCRALDEGLDVPDTSVGIIVAATSSVRQRIQRFGRILRKSPGKNYSELYTIYIEGLENNIFQEEEIERLESSAEKVEKISLSTN